MKNEKQEKQLVKMKMLKSDIHGKQIKNCSMCNKYV